MNPSTDGRDLAGNSGGMPLPVLEQRLADMENEPNWRPSADKCADYYDHKQSSAERVQRSLETGEPMTTVNLIQRTINGALGQEAKTRLNWKTDPDSDAFADVSAVLGEKLHEAQREARTDMAISEAYSSMLRTGIGWVEVSRNPDPMAYPYRVQAVHRNEVWWDWRAKLSDKSDAQWMVRQRWADLDEVQTLLPQFRELLEIGTHTGPITDAMARTINTSQGLFESIHSTRRSFSRVQEEWLDNSVRKRVRLYSVYYKAHKQQIALVSGSKRVKFNPKNPWHVAMVTRGGAKLMRGPSYEIRHAMFAGPFRLFDTVLPGRLFPLIPFVCYSCDDDFSPYGLVHGMIEPQDEFNERRSRLLWLLKAKQVFVDSDALDAKYNNLLDLAREVMRPDATFIMNPQRTNGANAMRIDSNPALGAEQANVMNDAKQLIQDVPGLFAPQFGSNRVGAESGLALNTLMEQSSASLGETSDNYRTSRQMVGEVVVSEIIEDHKDANMRVPVGSGMKRRVVVLNSMDPSGLMQNSVEDAQVKVALGDVPVTSAYRAQQQVFLSQALQAVGNDPIARAVLVPALLQAGDLEHRHEYAKWMRQKAGVPEPGDLADEKMQAQIATQQTQQAQAQEQTQQQLTALQMSKLQGDAAAAVAKARLTDAQALKTAEEAKVLAQPDIDALIDQTIAETV